MADDPTASLPEIEPGSVWLVGAGPGDPGLLTLLAVRALASADVIVHDALVDERVLRMANPAAILDYAGKRGGRPSPAQPDISNRLVALAREGRRVLRLKGGDPLVFGRGGEEASVLREAGIPFRIVPGITAGIGGLAYAGVPVTYRRIGQAVAFVTAHDLAGDLPDQLDWQALARIPTLVCYMAMRRLSAAATRLIAAGRNPEEPLAIVWNATRRDQLVIEMTLAAAASEVAIPAVEGPATVVIGAVVGLRATLDWFDPPAASP
jgi:uroporphyrin-III C-methyltransferase